MAPSAFKAPLPELLGNQTTLMFRHIPRKTSADGFISEVQLHAPHAVFDFVYVPWHRASKNNLGYAFINFVNQATALLVYQLMNGGVFGNDLRRKQIAIMPAVVQGFGNNLFHYSQLAVQPDPPHRPRVFDSGVEIPLEATLSAFAASQQKLEHGLVANLDVGFAPVPQAVRFAPLQECGMPAAFVPSPTAGAHADEAPQENELPFVPRLLGSADTRCAFVGSWKAAGAQPEAASTGSAPLKALEASMSEVTSLLLQLKATGLF